MPGGDLDFVSMEALLVHRAEAWPCGVQNMWVPSIPMQAKWCWDHLLACSNKPFTLGQQSCGCVFTLQSLSEGWALIACSRRSWHYRITTPSRFLVGYRGALKAVIHFVGGRGLAGRHLSGSIGVGTQAPKGSKPSDEPLWYLEAATVTQVLTVDPHA